MDSFYVKGKEKGIELCFENGITLEEALISIKEYCEKNKDFFKDNSPEISYKGLELDYFSEIRFEKELKKLFSKKAILQRKCTLTREEIFHSLENDETICKIYRGSVRSGEEITSRGLLVVIGDVNPTGILNAKEGIVVIGALRGIAKVKKGGFVYAGEMAPGQIKIGRVISYNKKRENVKSALATEENGEIILNCL